MELGLPGNMCIWGAGKRKQRRGRNRHWLEGQKRETPGDSALGTGRADPGSSTSARVPGPWAQLSSLEVLGPRRQAHPTPLKGPMSATHTLSLPSQGLALVCRVGASASQGSPRLPHRS